jgi:hypothetical protein
VAGSCTEGFIVYCLSFVVYRNHNLLEFALNHKGIVPQGCTKNFSCLLRLGEIIKPRKEFAGTFYLAGAGEGDNFKKEGSFTPDCVL